MKIDKNIFSNKLLSLQNCEYKRILFCFRKLCIFIFKNSIDSKRRINPKISIDSNEFSIKINWTKPIKFVFPFQKSLNLILNYCHINVGKGYFPFIIYIAQRNMNVSISSQKFISSVLTHSKVTIQDRYSRWSIYQSAIVGNDWPGPGHNNNNFLAWTFTIHT